MGKIGGVLNQVNALRGTTIPGQVATLEGYYASLNPATVDGLYASLASFQGSSGGFLSALQSLARATVVADVDSALALPDQSLATALAALILHMKADGESVAAATVSAAVAANAGNSGNPSLLVGTRTRYGYQQDNLFAETLTATVTGDAQSGTATLGREPIRFQGQEAASGPLGWDYPAGSGKQASIQCVDAAAAAQGGTGQWLANGSFESFTANVPAGWTIGVGAAGTQVLETTAAGTFYAGAAALALVGDGSTLTALTYPLAGVQPGGAYAFNLWAKVSAVPAAGVLEVALVDGSGAILLDVAGNASSATFSLPGLTTSFAPKAGFLRTPRVLPASVGLRLRLSTALSAGSSLYLDRLAFTQPGQLYAQGPRLAAFSGSSPAIVGDGWSVAVANDYGGAWNVLFDRLFGMKALGLLLPTSGSPTRANALIA